MKTKIFKTLLAAFLLVTGFGLVTSCSSDDAVTPEDNKEKTAEVSFNIDPQVLSRTVVEDLVAECGADWTAGGMYVDIEYTKDGIPGSWDGLELKSYSGNIKTEPQILKTGTYVIKSAIVYQTLDENSKVIYAGVKAGAEYAVYIDDAELMDNKTFTVGENETDDVKPFTKPTIEIHVLCAFNEDAVKFGMPKFEINFTEVTCLNLFLNVCDPTKDNEHEVGEGTIRVYDKTGTKLLNEDTFESGDLANFCFANNLQMDNEDEIYTIELTLTNSFLAGAPVKFKGQVSVETLLKYKTLSGWDTNLNLFHLVYCGEDEICFGEGFCLEKEEVITVKDFDYLVVRWTWTQADGKDLDVAFGIVDPKPLVLGGNDFACQWLGWSMSGNNKPYLTDYFKWGGDNRQDGAEAILIKMKDFRDEYLAELNTKGITQITFDTYLNWYDKRFNGNYNYQIIAYKGGTMTDNNYNWINTGGVEILNTAVNGNCTAVGHPSGAGIVNYAKAISIEYNVTTNTAIFKTVSQSAAARNSGTKPYIEVLEVKSNE